MVSANHEGSVTSGEYFGALALYGLDASHPMDFRIFSDGTNDMTVRNVRVIRIR